MQQTTHYNLNKPDTNDTYNKANDNANMDTIDAQMYANAQAAAAAQANGIPYVVDTSNTANTVTAAIAPAPAAYTDGLAVCVKIANTSTGPATLNLNGLGAVAILNGDGSSVGSGDLVAGVPVTLRYVGGASPAFIASGSGGLSGTGNATAVDVLAPYTFTSASGKKQTGTMPNNGGVTLTPSGTGTVQIPQGYHDGTGKVAQVSVPAANVLAGTTIAGVAGTMPENGALGTITPGTAAQNIPGGHTTGGTVAGDANLVASNIVSGKSIFGVAGNATPVSNYPHGSQSFTASGTFTVPANVTKITVKITGGGGSGACAITNASAYSTGGNSGTSVIADINVTPGQQYAVAIGSGGASVSLTLPSGTSAKGATGNAGSASSFGSVVTAPGGQGGCTSLVSGSINPTDNVGATAPSGAEITFNYGAGFMQGGYGSPDGGASIFGTPSAPGPGCGGGLAYSYSTTAGTSVTSGAGQSGRCDITW